VRAGVADRLRAQQAARQGPPCSFHARGACRFGASCRFSHGACTPLAALTPSARRGAPPAWPAWLQELASVPGVLGASRRGVSGARRDPPPKAPAEPGGTEELSAAAAGVAGVWGGGDAAGVGGGGDAGGVVYLGGEASGRHGGEGAESQGAGEAGPRGGGDDEEKSEEAGVEAASRRFFACIAQRGPDLVSANLREGSEGQAADEVTGDSAAAHGNAPRERTPTGEEAEAAERKRRRKEKQERKRAATAAAAAEVPACEHRARAHARARA
jgi:hypothetical protein